MCSASQLNTIVTKIAQRAITVFGNKLSSTVLYGSYARGDFDSESDIDIMILVDIPCEELFKYKQPFIELTSDLGLEHDIVITVTLRDTYTFDKYLHAVPFYQNVAKEGVKFA